MTATRRLLLSATSSGEDDDLTLATVHATPALIRLLLMRHREVVSLAARCPGIDSVVWWDATCTFTQSGVEALDDTHPEVVTRLLDDGWAVAEVDLAPRRTEHDLMHINERGIVWWTAFPSGSDALIETMPVAILVLPDIAERVH